MQFFIKAYKYIKYNVMKNRNSNFESDSRIFFQIRYKFISLLVRVFILTLPWRHWVCKKTKLLNKFLLTNDQIKKQNQLKNKLGFEY